MHARTRAGRHLRDDRRVLLVLRRAVPGLVRTPAPAHAHGHVARLAGSRSSTRRCSRTSSSSTPPRRGSSTPAGWASHAHAHGRARNGPHAQVGGQCGKGGPLKYTRAIIDAIHSGAVLHCDRAASSLRLCCASSLQALGAIPPARHRVGPSCLHVCTAARRVRHAWAVERPFRMHAGRRARASRLRGRARFSPSVPARVLQRAVGAAQPRMPQRLRP